MKVIIAIQNSTAQIITKPNNVVVEIRDYDAEDWEFLKLDDDGDAYQEMLFE